MASLIFFTLVFVLIPTLLLMRAGHMSYLKKVRSTFSDPVHLVVGVCSDETVESYKR
jgi:bifunctional ADP-heptose synthase (sugar kinase/adenylyltransferase)